MAATKTAAPTTSTTTVATTAMAILASRTSRACDVCASKSARWYCGADAAFLCDRCDTQVHTANSLAQRHERVRLTSSGTLPVTTPPQQQTPRKSGTKSGTKITTTKSKKSSSTPPPQLPPARKRTRSSRPHPHRRIETPGLQQHPSDNNNNFVHVKVEDANSYNLFAQFFDTEDFLIDHPQEVPSLSNITESPSPSETASEFSNNYQSEYSPFSPGSSTSGGTGGCCFSPESFQGAGVSSPDSFAAYFKGKAALQDDNDVNVLMKDINIGDREFGFVPDHDGGIDIICCDADGNISLAGDACFVPGDIPGLDAFDDCSLSFDLALRGASSEAFEGDNAATATAGTLASKTVAQSNVDQYANGPFAKYFVMKKMKITASNNSQQRVIMSSEIIKLEAREILRCCTEEGSERAVPTLRLNYEEIIAAWSDRGQPWVSPMLSESTDVGLVPDMGLPEPPGADDHDHGDGASRDARVLRYKEKRHSRLFSKTIRYEVRKLNAKKRPRMKGRFVRRTNTGVS